MGAIGEAGLAAGGTLIRPYFLRHPDASRRIRLLLEIGVFFVVAPIVLVYAIYGLNIPLFVALQPLLLAFLIYLAWDKTFNLRRELRQGFSARVLLSILVLFLIAGGFLAALVQQQLPRAFLSFPRQRPQVWLTVVLLYPVLSVVTQELVYRTFFFHRYGPLFGDKRWLAILTNGCLFGFAHIIFYNWVAILGTTISGTLFAYRYTETRSFWAVWLEHSLYGILIFSIGLGGYFFTGISNIAWRW
jgi:membrane protease YdiL (CAAX protease family)